MSLRHQVAFGRVYWLTRKGCGASQWLGMHSGDQHGSSCLRLDRDGALVQPQPQDAGWHAYRRACCDYSPSTTVTSTVTRHLSIDLHHQRWNDRAGNEATEAREEVLPSTTRPRYGKTALTPWSHPLSAGRAIDLAKAPPALLRRLGNCCGSRIRTQIAPPAAEGYLSSRNVRSPLLMRSRLAASACADRPPGARAAGTGLGCRPRGWPARQGRAARSDLDTTAGAGVR
jgi:hypothetical protein